MPDDYATIQEAVDAAAAGTKINVKSGSYVVVETANLDITASGNVTLSGSFTLNANGITINKFKIKIVDQDNGRCVTGNNVSGAEIGDNNFSGRYSAIVFMGSTNCTIKGNTISRGTQGGIVFDKSDNNAIDENTLTGDRFKKHKAP